MILNAAIPVVEIWDLTPTPIDMLVGFSHEKLGRRWLTISLQKVIVARACYGPPIAALVSVNTDSVMC